MTAQTYPRPVETIHQIEVTTRCNLRCRYCPFPKQHLLRQQEPMDMTMETFKRALEWVVALNGRFSPPAPPHPIVIESEHGPPELVPGTHQWRLQRPWGAEAGAVVDNPQMAELSLTGIGEALLHPDFPLMLRLAREALPHAPLVFSTNGILLTDAYCERIAEYEPMIYVSLHRPEKAGHAIQAAKRHGILAGYNPSPATSAFDWAGQVDWFVSHDPAPCEFLRSGWGVVLVDGRITTCCLDASALGVVGHVDDPIGSVSIEPFSLCPSCSYSVP